MDYMIDQGKPKPIDGSIIEPDGHVQCRRYIRTTVFMAMFILVMMLTASCGTTQDQVDASRDPDNIYVMDAARVLSNRTKKLIYQKNKEWEKTDRKAQLLVVTVNGIPNNESIEDYTMGLANKYKPGDGRKDTGLVFLLDTSGQDRLEVGYGLEDLIPDVRAKRITETGGDDFHNGDYDKGVRKVVGSIDDVLAGKQIAGERTVDRIAMWTVIIIALLIIVPILLYLIIEVLLFLVSWIVSLIRPLRNTRIGKWADDFDGIGLLDGLSDGGVGFIGGLGSSGGGSSFGGGSFGGGGASSSF